MNLRDALRATNIALDRETADKQRFDALVCQCCGFARRKATDPECVCDGLNWHMSKDGRVECEAHRFARAIGDGKKSFFPWSRK